MMKAWFKLVQLGAAATLMTASAGAVTRSVPSTAISTYQNFSCFIKQGSEIRLSSSTSCRYTSLYTWLPVAVSPTSSTFSASVRRFREGGSGCYGQDACIQGYTSNAQGDLYAASGWVCGSSGWDDVATGSLSMTSGGTAAVAFRTFGQSGCTIEYGAVTYTF